MKGQSTIRSGGVDGLDQGFEPDTPIMEFLNNLNQIFGERASRSSLQTTRSGKPAICIAGLPV
jgi:hypothetical protein